MENTGSCARSAGISGISRMSVGSALSGNKSVRNCVSRDAAALLLLLVVVPMTTDARGLYGCFPDVDMMGLADNGNLICRDTYAVGTLPRYISCVAYNTGNSSQCDRACDHYTSCIGYQTPSAGICTLCHHNTSASTTITLNLKFQKRGCPSGPIPFYNADWGPSRLAEKTITVQQLCSNIVELTDAYGVPTYCNTIVTFRGGIFPVLYMATLGPLNYTPPIRFEFDLYRSSSQSIEQMIVPSFVLIACVLLVWWRSQRR